MNQWTTHNEEYKALLKSMEKVAIDHDYCLNSDADRRAKVLGLMTENLVATGKPYCPCKQSHPLNPEKDVLCPCPDYSSEISKDGHCLCRLFFKKV